MIKFAIRYLPGREESIHETAANMVKLAKKMAKKKLGVPVTAIVVCRDGNIELTAEPTDDPEKILQYYREQVAHLRREAELDADERSEC